MWRNLQKDQSESQEHKQLIICLLDRKMTRHYHCKNDQLIAY